MRMILDLFAGGHSVTVLKDAGISAASADETNDVQKNATVTLTVTPATGYVIAEYEVIAGGVEVDPSAKTFKMGEADVVIYVRSKAANKYLVTEETRVSVNDAVVILHANTIVELTKNGVPKAVSASGGGTTITMNDAVRSLINQEILIPI